MLTRSKRVYLEQNLYSKDQHALKAQIEISDAFDSTENADELAHDFDRILIAQAQTEDLQLMTKGSEFPK